MNDIQQIALILTASLVATVVSKRLNIPAVIGQMLMGVILAPALLGWIHNGHTLEVMSEIGVILLMFLAGLEADLSLLKRYFKSSLLVALAGVIVPLAVFWLITSLLGYSFNVSVFYGIVFAATSVSITVEVLQEYGKLSTRAGNIILGAAIVDDILAVVILSIFRSTSAASDGNLLVKGVLTIAFFLVLVFVHKFIPRFWKFVERLKIFAKHTTVALLVCLGLSLLANAVGMSAVIGSFFAGIAISQTEPAKKIEEYISAIAYVVFIPIFFMSIAISMSFKSLISQPLLIMLFTMLAVLTKFVPAYFAAKFSGLENDESLLVGTGMISRGEMALIVVQIGLSSKIISDGIYSELVVVILLTTLLAPFLIKLSLKARKTNK
ncbi:MAG: cation:proton antiporter [Streptococcaceae bacterium]|jgi:monovalent cation:proton antiporter-2 (CPA2) family protein|nr:cation:proton antiporter [Streptococcaceae bacterium]